MAGHNMNEGYRICPICEAGCGLKVSADGRQVLEIKANDDDIFSSGHVCAKGIALTELDVDPDRLRVPLIKIDGGFREASWDEAYALINERLGQVVDEFGGRSVAMYIGNPSAHNIGLAMGLGVVAQSLGTPHIYSAGSVDQLPKQLASELMFGNGNAVPVPDIERADFLLMLGANPVVSNGSLWMVPGFRDKLRTFQRRGGRLVTVDPRRTETARLADHHHFIKPGTDVWLLAAIINLLEKDKLSGYNTTGAEALFTALERIDPRDAAQITGIPEEEIRDIAAALANAKQPVVYGRVGTTLQKHGTLTSFLIEVINLLSGSLDQAGGAMFPEQPYRTPGSTWQGPAYNRYQTRVSSYPEVLGQFPVAALAEEIETAGEGQIKAMICLAGNPVVSNPDGDRLTKALTSLDFLVCVDIYHTETSKLADVILPGTSPFEDVHYDQFLGAMGYRNVARYSPRMFEPNNPDEWQMGLTVAYMAGQKKVPTPSELREFEDGVVAGLVSAHCADPTSPIYGRDVQEIMAQVEPAAGVERMLEVGIRAGQWGDWFGEREGLTLKALADEPNGVDFGEIKPGRLGNVVQRTDGKIDFSPDVILKDIDCLQAPGEGFVLIGRRHTRSNNSWLRNIPMLGKGKPLCVLEMHSEDAKALGVAEGDSVLVSNDNAELKVPVRCTEDLARGVVAMPHGFSNRSDLRQRNLVAGENYNRLARANDVDQPSGTAALNGILVNIQPI